MAIVYWKHATSCDNTLPVDEFNDALTKLLVSKRNNLLLDIIRCGPVLIVCFYFLICFVFLVGWSG